MKTRKNWKDYACGYETPRQRYIRHNFPHANHLRTKREVKEHELVAEVLKNADK